MSRIKRTLTLDSDFKDLDPQTENSKNHFEGSLHIGLIKPIKEKYFIGIEGFVGRLFGEDYFKPQMNFGAKALAGFNVNDKLRLYAGAGVNFMRIKSLKINLNNKNHNLSPWRLPNAHPDYQITPMFQGNIGIEFMTLKNLSVKLDGQLLFNTNKTFSKTRILNLPKGLRHVLDDLSYQKYKALKISLGLFYNKGF